MTLDQMAVLFFTMNYTVQGSLHRTPSNDDGSTFSNFRFEGDKMTHQMLHLLTILVRNAVWKGANTGNKSQQAQIIFTTTTVSRVILIRRASTIICRHNYNNGVLLKTVITWSETSWCNTIAHVCPKTRRWVKISIREFVAHRRVVWNQNGETLSNRTNKY